MDLDLDEPTEQFRTEVRDFLAASKAHFPTESYDTAAGFEQHRRWDRILFETPACRSSPGPRSSAVATPPCCSGWSTRRSTSPRGLRHGPARTASRYPSRELFEVRASGTAWDADIESAREFGALATTAQLVGAGQALLHGALNYAEQRTQFGRAIGSYQAIKHKFADVHIALELARPLVYGAALSLADRSSTTARDVSAAKAAASEAGLLAARSALQTHGAIGFTREHDMSLALLRVQALRSAWGDPIAHRRRVLEAL